MNSTPAGANQGQYADLVPLLAAFPDEVARLLTGTSVEALKRPTSDGGWGVIENLGHLADWEEIFLSRVRAVLTEDDPRLPAFDDQLWEVEHDYRAQDPFKVLARFRDRRRQLVEALGDVAPDAWTRTARIGSKPRVTLADIVQRIRQHDVDHARAIADALS